jgi:dihydroorotase-like cyclic amidohydrolase
MSYGRLRWRKLVISWCSTNDNRVFVIKSFKMGNFTNVELTDMVLAYVRRRRRVATRSKRKYYSGKSFQTGFTSTVQRLKDTGKFHPRTEDRGRDRSQYAKAST